MQRSSKSEFRFVRSQDNYFFHFPGYFKLYYRHRQPRHLTNSASAVLFISPRFVLHLRFCTLREYSWGPEAVTFFFSFFFFFFFFRFWSDAILLVFTSKSNFLSSFVRLYPSLTAAAMPGLGVDGRPDDETQYDNPQSKPDSYEQEERVPRSSSFAFVIKSADIAVSVARDFLELGPDDLRALFIKNRIVFGGLLRVSEHLFDGLQIPEEFHVFAKLHQKHNALNVRDDLPLASNRLVHRGSKVICICFLDNCNGYGR